MILEKAGFDTCVFRPERIELYYNEQLMELDHQSIDVYNIRNGSTILLYDTGTQIPLRISKLTVYFGPLLIVWLFSRYHIYIFEFLMSKEYLEHQYEELLFYKESNVQLVAKSMIYLHFGKMLLETIFLRNTAGYMTSLSKTVHQSALTWVILAFMVGQSIFKPNYQPAFDLEPEYADYYLGAISILFLLFEFLNFLCHYHFEDVLLEVI